MLQSIRRGATTMAFKIIIGLFIVALVMLFAMGDYVTQFGGSGGQNAQTTVAVDTPGRDITEYELSNSLYGIASRFRSLYDNGLDTPEDLRESGLLDLAQESLVATQVRTGEVDRLGLVASEERINSSLRLQTQFFDGEGRFDQRRFELAINNQGLNTEGYLNLLSNQIATGDLNSIARVSPESLPESLIKPIIDFRLTERRFEAVTIPASAVDAPELSDDDVKAYIAENRDDYLVPEMRRVSALLMTIESIKDEAAITDEEISAAFVERRASLNVPERRELQQVVFPTEEAANEAAEKLKDVSVTLEEVADLGGGLASLGNLTRVELAERGPDLANAAFDIPVLAVTDPIRTDFGWHIMTSLRRTEGVPATLEAFSDEIRTELAETAARSVIERLADDADNLIGEGASLDEVAETIEIDVSTFEPFTSLGRGPDRRRVVGLPSGTSFTQSAFQTDVGEVSLLGELPNEAGFFILSVEEEFEGRDQTFEEAEAFARTAAERADRHARLDVYAQELIAAAQGEDRLASIADTLGAELIESEAVTRAELRRQPNVVRFAAEDGFNLQLNELTALPAGNDYMIISAVEQIEPSAVAESEEGQSSADVASSFAEGLVNDIRAQMLSSLVSSAKIKTNEAAIERVLDTVAEQIANTPVQN